MFEDAKVGQKLWDVRWGWGEVKSTDVGKGSHPLWVEFDHPTCGLGACYFDLNGVDDCLFKQTLFWDEVKITPPPKPKKEVTVEGWINLYVPSEMISEDYIWSSSGMFKTQELADQAKGFGRLGEAVHILHKYKEG